MEESLVPYQVVEELIRAGRILDAWEQAKASGLALAKWPPGPALRVAAILADALGAGRLARILEWRNWRADRADPPRYFHALFGRMRFRAGWNLIPEVESFLASHPGLTAEVRADLLAFLTMLHAGHRDFPVAFATVTQALELQPEDAWTHVIHSNLLEQADRYEEALRAAEQAVALRPLYRPAVLQRADVLVHLGRDDEAIRLLEEATEQTQNAAFPFRLQALYSEREDHLRGLRCLEQAEQRSPLREKDLVKWLAARRADFHFMAGNIDACLECCAQAGDGFHKRIAARLQEPGARERKRVRLSVPFVRQHNLTCAPATLAAICAFWGKPHDHLTIAEAICHEGTPWHKERQWAEDNGFLTREFRLTPEILRELIDRGVPFTLTTQAVTSGHLQACIGYDDRTGVVLLRDPTERHFGEMILEALLETHPLDGPRGMVVVPPEESHRLKGLEFPHGAAYDAYHELLKAIDGNDPQEIALRLKSLQAVAPESALAHAGSESVAGWEQNAPGQLAAIEAQLALAPDHQPLLLRKSYVFGRLGRWLELRAFLEELVLRPGMDPVFTSELGELLAEDARLLPRAHDYLRKVVRYRRSEARVYHSLAFCLAKQRRHGDAARLRRIAACLAPGNDSIARAYFDDCRVLRRTEEGIAFLDERARRIGKKDGGAWITLAQVLNEVRSDRQAATVLEEAMAVRPEDGDLRLRAGAMMVGWGEAHRQRGLELMEGSRGHVPEAFWLDETARMAAYLGDRVRALGHYRELVALQPLAINAWRGLARLSAEQEGEQAAIALLDEATGKHPDVPALWTLKAQWLAGTKRGAREALDELLKLNPQSRWALRERAMRRVEVADYAGAEADVHEAIALDPWESESRSILGFVLQRSGKIQEARECMREALRLSVDNAYAASRLVAWSDGAEESQAAVRFIETEMRRQVSNGEIVPTYQDLAWPHLEPLILLAHLKEFCAERPDLWQTWSARAEQALRMRLDDEALAAVTTLTENFPLLPRAWLELARVHRAAGRHLDEEAAARQAVALAPGWDTAARTHAEVLEGLGRSDEAVTVLQRACQLDPLNGPNHGSLAEVLRRGGRGAEALAHLGKALELCPYYAWGWTKAASWALEDGAAEDFGGRLERASEGNGHHPAWWPIAADTWEVLRRSAERMKAIRQGLEMAPGDADLRDKLALQLFEEQRYEEALAACAPCGSETQAPVNLRGRRAWILLHSGQPLEGVKEMQAIIEQEPDYSWGFGELADWYYRRSEWTALRDHCQRWVRAAPPEARILGFLGLAELELQNRDAAKQAFVRSHALDPTYPFAGRQLFDLQLEAGELEAAATTLAKLERYCPGPQNHCHGVDLDLKRSDVQAALRRVDALLGGTDPGLGPFDWLTESFTRAGQRALWQKWLTERVKAGPVPVAGILHAFLQLLPEKKALRSGRKWVARQPVHSEAHVAGWMVLLEVARRRRDLRRVLHWMAKHRQELHGESRLWNDVADVLLRLKAGRAGVAWLGGWHDRSQDVTVGTLVNLSALYDCAPGDFRPYWAAALEVRREAFRRFPDGRLAQAIRAGLAFQLAAAGQHSAARELLANFDRQSTTEFYRAIADAARAIVAAADGDEAGAQANLRDALAYWCRYRDLATTRRRERTLSEVAQLIPWTKGKPRRLRQRWELPETQGDSSTVPWLGLTLIGIVLIILTILQSCTELMNSGPDPGRLPRHPDRPVRP